ncbi:MAG: putative toxin-antitoxin system toxin component, PIN family [Methylococcus sp.]|jgi:uncharacterized protein
MPSLYIIDTNVLVAGLISSNPASPPVRILDAMLNGEIIYVLSPDLLAEYRAVLLRPRISKIHRLAVDEVEVLLTEIAGNAVWREPDLESKLWAPDPGDDHLWHLLDLEPPAILITGDRLLLTNPPVGRSLITPAGYFLKS